jgi:hypothetical protein
LGSKRAEGEGEFFAANAEDILRRLEWIRRADLVIGVPSFKEADNIGYVVSQCDEGAREYFPEHRAVIVNVDNSSPDGTREAFISAGSMIPQIYITTPVGIRGKGNNFYNLFQAARILDAKAIVAVDADLESITPRWVHNLASPVLEHGCDYVAPLYSRNEYDGTITNHLCYPLIYGILGTDLRQPIGGDFGFSGLFVRRVLEESWGESTREYGIDIFLTLQALLGRFCVGQTTLGAKVHKPSAPKLGPMFTQVVTTLFTHLIRSRDQWATRGNSTRAKVFDGIELTKPQGLALDYKAIKGTALAGYAQERRSMRHWLQDGTLEEVDRLMDGRKMRLGADLWARIVFDLLYAFHRTRRNARVIEVLKPLFFARVASFIRETLDLDHQASEGRIGRQARAFRRQRSYVMELFGISS